MTLDEIRKYINYVCVKENTGGTLTPIQINNIFPAASTDLQNKTIEKAQMYALQNKIPFSKAIYEFKSMGRFRKKKNIPLIWDIIGSAVSPSPNYLYLFTADMYNLVSIGDYISGDEIPSGSYVVLKTTAGGNHAIGLNNSMTDFTTPVKHAKLTNYNSANYNLDILGDYAYWLSLMTIYGGMTKSIDVITDQELDERRSNSLALDITQYPVAIINNNLINVLPNDITNAEFTYLRKPITPVYDYYIDANLNEIYLPAGSSHTLTSGETGSAGQTSGTTVNSNTVELDWDPIFHIEFCNEVLQRVAPHLKDAQLAQYAAQSKAEQS
jgi:hypothetical protein